MADLYRLFLHVIASRARILGLALFGVLLIVQAALVRHGQAGPDVALAARIVSNIGIGIFAPVIALVFSSAALGDLVDDGTLVYVWLRPQRRERIVGAALAAALTMAIPLAVVPVALQAFLVATDASVVWGAVAATVIAVVAYSTVFLALGLRVRRALPWGLAYVLVWEGAVARRVTGAARLSLRVHADTLFAKLSHTESPRLSGAPATAVIVLVLAAIVGAVLATLWLRSAEVA